MPLLARIYPIFWSAVTFWVTIFLQAVSGKKSVVFAHPSHLESSLIVHPVRLHTSLYWLLKLSASLFVRLRIVSIQVFTSFSLEVWSCFTQSSDFLSIASRLRAICIEHSTRSFVNPMEFPAEKSPTGQLYLSFMAIPFQPGRHGLAAASISCRLGL